MYIVLNAIIHFSLQAIHAVGVLLSVPEASEVAKKLFAKLFAALLLRVGVSSTIDDKDSKTKAPSSTK